MTTTQPVVVDNMVLAVFVDSGSLHLLSALAGGSFFVTPTIVNPLEQTSLTQDGPLSEFGSGARLHHWSGSQDPTAATRYQRRHAFYTQRNVWTPLEPSEEEIQLAFDLTQPEVRAKVRQMQPNFKVKRINPGEAECAALAIMQCGTLWSDDQGIVTLMDALYPRIPVERTCALVARAVNEKHFSFEEGQVLFEREFKQNLGLYTPARLILEAGKARCVVL